MAYRELLFYLDKKWCGSSLLSTDAIVPLCNHSNEVNTLALLRVLSALSMSGELVGLFFMLYGAMWAISSFFIVGAFIKIISHLIAGTLHNRSGAFLSLWWVRHLTLLYTYQREFSGILNKLGLTDIEIKSIPTLPAELYNSEINSYPYSFIINVMTPLICAVVLMLHGNFYMSLLIGIIGATSLPLGRWFYKQFNFRQQREQRLAQTAKEYPYLECSYKKHVRLTLSINTITQLPLVLFTLIFFFGGPAGVFGNYLAFTMGLAGLSGLLAFQKLRVTSQQAVDKAKHILFALDGPEFLITPHRWQEHIMKGSNFIINKDLKNGIVIEDFMPTAFGGEGVKPVTASIPAGGTYLLQAPSGHGKSTLILALLHMIEHKGELFFIENGIVTNIHKLDREDWQESVIFFREADIPVTARLVDLFNEILKNKLFAIFSEIEDLFSKQLANLAFNGSDNLLEREIVSLQNQELSPFPPSMLPFLIQMREKRREVMIHILEKNFNTNYIYPERVFCTLSAGEQRRIINLLTLETASIRKSRIVVFDEPFAHLDRENIEKQLNQIKKFQIEKPIPLFIITHQHIKEITEQLENVQHYNNL